MHEETNAHESLLAEIRQRSEELAPDYLYNDIGPLLYVFSAPVGASLPAPGLQAA